MRLQSAIFDMDGTLLDSMGMWRTLASVLARNHGKEVPPDLDRKVASLGLREGTAYCKEVCGLSARMVVNQVSMKRENERISQVIKGLQKIVREE